MTPEIPVLYHPSHLLGEKLRERGMTPDAFRKECGMSESDFEEFWSGRSPVTKDMAQRFSRILGTTAELWTEMQKSFDEAERVATASAIREGRVYGLEDFDRAIASAPPPPPTYDRAPHPSRVLRDGLKYNGVSLKKFRKACATAGITAAELNDFWHGRAPVTRELAEKLARIIAPLSPEDWLRMQADYERERKDGAA